MGVVKTEHMYVEPLGKSWRRQIHFKNNRFEIPMPDEFQTLFPEEKITGESIAVVEQAFKKALVKWKTVNTHVRKVIAYAFYFNNEKYDHLEANSFGSGENPELAVGFSYVVCFERSVAGKKQFYTLKKNPFYRPAEGPHQDKNEFDEHRSDFAGQSLDRERNAKYRKVIVVDWSEERELFFQQMEEGMKKMIQRAITFNNTLKEGKQLDEVIKNKITGSGVLALPPVETSVGK